MDTIRLQSVTVEGFRTFVKKTTFDFPEHGLVLVRGINRDTAGADVDFDNSPAASGIGKTNLLLAIAYLFDFCPLSATQLQSWDDSVSMKVVGKFTAGDKQVTICRAPKGSYVEIDGKKHTSSDAIKAELQALTGLTPELRSILTYRQQRERGMFLHATDGEKKKFLTTVLPWLKDWEVAADAAQKRANDMQKDVDTKKAVFDAAQSDLSLLEGASSPVYEDVASLEAEKEILVDIEQVRQAAFKKARVAVDDLKTAIDVEALRIRNDNGPLTMTSDLLKRFDSTVTVPLELQKELRQAQDAAVAEQPIDPALLETEAKAKDLLRQVRERLSLIQKADAERKVEHDKKLKEITLRGQELRTAEKLVPGAQKAVDELREKISIAEQSLCSQCGQQWIKAKDTVEEWKRKLVAAEGLLSDLKDQAAKIPEIVAEYEAARIFEANPKIKQYLEIESSSAVDATKAEANVRAATAAAETAAREAYGKIRVKVEAEKKLLEAKKREEYATLKAEVEAARAKIEMDVNAYIASKQEELSAAREAADDTRDKWGKAVDEVREVGSKIEQMKTRNESARKQYEQTLRLKQAKELHVEKLRAEHAALRADWAREQDFSKLVGREGYLGSIFDEILEEIAAETNTILLSLPNVSHVTVEFVSESTTKSGSTSREIKSILRVNGIETNAKGGLSGGQQSATEWAMDLAVGAVIGRRLGANLAFLMLDETFDGLDSITKEAALEVLQTYAQDRVVLVVTHANEFKEFFPKTIDLEFQGGETRLVA